MDDLTEVVVCLVMLAFILWVMIASGLLAVAAAWFGL